MISIFLKDSNDKFNLWNELRQHIFDIKFLELIKSWKSKLYVTSQILAK